MRTRPSRCGFFVACVVTAPFLTDVTALSHSALAGEIVQYFPAVPSGQTPPRAESGWRIKYEILPAPVACVDNQNAYGCSDVLEIQGVEFMRGYTESGDQNWIRILNKIALAEMFVVYNNGINPVFDIYGNKSELAKNITPTDVGAVGVITQEIRDNRVVVEVADDHARWAKNQSGQIRRGQVLDLWATLFAGDYDYILRYSFLDDGTIRVRVGASGRNQSNGIDDNAVHVHMPVWRFEFDLGAAAANSVEIMERQPDPNRYKAQMVHRPFNRGLEGGEVWNPERFTTLMVTNHQLRNRHDPAHDVAYKLISHRFGSVRTPEPHTLMDFWVTRLRPRSSVPASGSRLRFIDLPYYFSNPPARIDGEPVAIWHSVPFLHVPRSEDFGARGYTAADGLTLTMWSGFDLMPHNLWDKTPFYQAPSSN
jgi:hypothetical protein